MSAIIVNLASFRKTKLHNNRLKKRLEEGGWTIDSLSPNQSHQACVYLLDRDEDASIIFGCQLTDFNIPESKLTQWRDFTLAWEIIANPTLNFDDRHKQDTIEHGLKALPTLSGWAALNTTIEKASENQEIFHLIIIIDRNNLEKPLELIPAFSSSLVMNSQSIGAILSSYFSKIGC